MDFKINKDNWDKVTLGDVVFEPKETAKDIIAEGFEHIVGLEHIESGDVHLRNSFSNDTDTTFTKVFRAGDILFGRRRAYLKKAAQGSFDGVCSGDITVMRANDKLDVRLLPFVIHNDKFFDYAVKHSAGGLSPRVKFKDLANYEFLLPPKAQQAELADLLWAMDNVIEKDLEVLERFEVLLNSKLKQLFTSKESKTLLSLCKEKPKYGSNTSAVSFDGQTRYIRITDIGKFNFLNDELVSSEKPEDKYLLEYGDFLLARSADPGRSYYYLPEHGRCIHAGYLIKFKLDMNLILPEYLYLYTQTEKFKTWINQTTRKGTLSNINSEEFGKINVPIASVSKQQEIVDSSKIILEQLSLVESKLQSSKALQKALINQFF